MPSCINCTKFDSKKEICSALGDSPIRKCIITSLESHLSSMKNKTICEIGCGEWSFAKNIVETNNCKWLGIDPREYDPHGRKILRTHAGTANSIPLETNSVDVVLAIQSLEHWYEYGTTFRSGFLEIHRILKLDGLLIMNFPIHLHGHPIFLNGEINKIKRLWNPYLWTKIHFEEWRKNHEPLEPYEGWKLNKNPINKTDDSIYKSTWIMDVVATKTNKKKHMISCIYDFSTLIIDLRQGKPISLKLIKSLTYRLLKKVPTIAPLYKLIKSLFTK